MPNWIEVIRGFDCVLPSFLNFPGTDWVSKGLMGINWILAGFDWRLLGFTRFYLILGPAATGKTVAGQHKERIRRVNTGAVVCDRYRPVPTKYLKGENK